MPEIQSGRRLGLVIESWLEENDVRQKTIALRCGISMTFMSDIVRGHRQPSAQVSKLMAKAMSIDPDYFEYLCGRLPTDIVNGPKMSSEDFEKAIKRFRE